MSAEIREVSEEEITLIPGDGGIFEIRYNGQILFKKPRGGAFPEPGEAASLLGSRP